MFALAGTFPEVRLSPLRWFYSEPVKKPARPWGESPVFPGRLGTPALNASVGAALLLVLSARACRGVTVHSVPGVRAVNFEENPGNTFKFGDLAGETKL